MIANSIYVAETLIMFVINRSSETLLENRANRRLFALESNDCLHSICYFDLGASRNLTKLWMESDYIIFNKREYVFYSEP